MRRVDVPVIGLTGGIASGKSTVERAFQQLGVTVFDADQVARDLVEPGQPALAAIVERFGADSLDSAGRLDRQAMRARVFQNADERRALEAILHPAIRGQLLQMVSRIETGYVVVAIPLLVDVGRYDWIDRVLVVDVPREVQLFRLMQRDSATHEQASAALAAQVTRGARLMAADDVIVNDGPQSLITHAVARLHRRYCQLLIAPKA